MDNELNKDFSIRSKYQKILSYWLEGDFEESKETWKKRIFKSPKALAEKMLEYFVEKEELGLPLTYTGMILEIGLRTRSGLDHYKSYGEDFESLIDTVKLIIEEYNVAQLYTKYGFRASQFILKTNYKYSETINTVIENREYIIDINKPKEED